jgi:hypothetical protein
MQRPASHPGLELRLEALGARIRTLRENADKAEGIAKIEAHREIAQLEHRHQDLENRLSELKREDPGFRHEMKKKLEKLAFDLSGSVEEFILRTDSRFHPEKPSK